jgi:hypothetical protein
MAWYAGATRMELRPEAGQQPSIRPTQLIVHSIAGPWTPRRTYEYWRDSTSLESHFGLGYDGTLAQYVGTETRADANAGANRRPDGTGAVSIETASNTGSTDPWTEQQIEELIRLGVWMHQRHGVPLRICRTADDPGFGWHSLHRAWSTSGTACPGSKRIAQFREVAFPAIVARTTGAPAARPIPAPEEDPLPRLLALCLTERLTIAAPGVWVSLPFDTEWADPLGEHADDAQSFAAGGTNYTGALYLRMSGLEPGREVQVRIVEGSGGNTRQLPPIEGIGTAGGSFPAVPLVGRVSPDHRAKVMLAHFNPGPLVIERAELKLHVWKDR